jgi:hypothetical protein
MILYPGLSVGKNKDFIGNYSIYEHPPPQGLSEARRGWEVY